MGRDATFEDVRGERIGDALYTGLFSGSGVASRLRAALDQLKSDGTSQRIVISRPTDGSILDWDQRVDIVTGDHPGGVHIDVEEGVEINGTLEDWWITVDGNSGGQTDTFHLDGLHTEWQFTGNQSADPGCPGFIRIDDQNEAQIEGNFRGFQNGTGNALYGGTGSVGDSTVIFMRNIDGFQEGWRYMGNIRTSDRGFDTIHPNHPDASTEVANGSGDPGFRDGMFLHASIAGRDFGARFRGNHKGFNAVNLHMFTDEPNATALVLDGNLSGANFSGFTVDDAPDPETGSVAITTESEYVPSGAPIFYGTEFNEIETFVNYNEAAADVWEVKADGNDVGLYDMAHRDGNGSGMFVDAGGEFTTEDASGEVIRIDGNGIVRTGVDQWSTGSAPYFTDGLRTARLSTDPNVPGNEGAILYVSDGSAGVTGDNGDFIIALGDGSSTKYHNLVDFSTI